MRHIIGCGVDAQIIFINGKGGEGKSYFVKNYLVRQIPCRFIIYDLNWEYTKVEPKVCVVTHRLEDVRDYYNQGKTFIVFQPLDKTESDFNKFCGLINKMANLCVVIEEINAFCTSNKIPPEAKRLIDRGRHLGIGIIGTARRSKGISADIPFNASHIFCFRQVRPEDVKYLGEYIGTEADKLKTLKKYWFLWYDGFETTEVEPV